MDRRAWRSGSVTKQVCYVAACPITARVVGSLAGRGAVTHNPRRTGGLTWDPLIYLAIRDPRSTVDREGSETEALKSEKKKERRPARPMLSPASTSGGGTATDTGPRGMVRGNWEWYDPSHAHRIMWPDGNTNPILTS